MLLWRGTILSTLIVTCCFDSVAQVMFCQQMAACRLARMLLTAQITTLYLSLDLKTCRQWKPVAQDGYGAPLRVASIPQGS